MNVSNLTVRDELVEINGSKIFTKLYGVDKKKITIVMDAGYGDYSKAWDTLIPDLAEIANVFVYDRPGLGKSEKSSTPRTSLEMIKELNEVLLMLHIKPPYILVGHSFGGVNMRLFATRFPIEVAGMVLIDSTPEEYRERFLPTMSSQFQEAYNKQFIYEGTYDEFMESLSQLRQEKSHLGNLNLTIISAGNKAHYSKESQDLWNEMQKEMLSISNNSEFVIAENSAHYIQYDEPLIVVKAIKKLINKLNHDSNLD
ncbi:alpha/beta fold hydrolase [Paenisporosarcina indica]|uniref:alpha/beta fold hydrolase n=1 Tax=Paenisporosarcina indica TaxID=650093 RepID=UPI00094FD5C0|nr:alpha/beta fold hydrolase [Paenisporosarcina indica]